jgi:hypothetical protein
LISRSQDLIDSVLERYSEIKNIKADFCTFMKLHRLITVEYKDASTNKLSFVTVKFVEEWAK